MCTVHKSVQHGVGNSGIANMLVPVLYGHLTGDDGKCSVVSYQSSTFRQTAALFRWTSSLGIFANLLKLGDQPG